MAMLQQMVEVLNSTFSELPTLANEEAKVIIRERKFSATTLSQSFLLAGTQNDLQRANGARHVSKISET